MSQSVLNKCRPPLLDIPVVSDNDTPLTVTYDLCDNIPKQSDLVLFGCWSAEDGEDFKLPAIVNDDPEDKELLSDLVSRTKFKGALNATQIERANRSVRKGLFGFGSATRFRRENLFYAGLQIGHKIKETHSAEPTIVLDETMKAGDIRILLWRIGCGLRDTDCYKGKKEEETTVTLKAVHFVCKLSKDEFEQVRNRALAQIQGGLLSMALCNAPPNYCNCITLERTIKKCFDGVPHFNVIVLDEEECRARKMGSFLGVAQGSYHGARLIHLHYKRGDAKKKVAFVGKGITLDTGGLQIKTGDGMLDMKCDKGGASAVIGTAMTIGKLQPNNFEGHFIAMVCDNSVSDRAMYPRDILTASNGKTIEITHTDAEGRLALADGLVYAEEQLGGPGKGVIVDIATLTGAALVGMGADIACVYSNDDDTLKEVINSAQANGEPAWALPLWPAYRKQLNSDIADIKNTGAGPKYGGSIMAATFLQEFVDPKTKWVHIDAAGPLWNFEKHEATGWGIGLLTDFALLSAE